MKKHYTQAPLPFQGQKRRWNAEFKKALGEFTNCNVFIDLFGGSGLLSRMVKDTRPDAVVIYNDFDNYRRRIDNIPRTNALLADLRTMLQGYPKGHIIREPLRNAILERIRQEADTGFVDYITISASLLFSMKYVTSLTEMLKESLYCSIKQTDYNADGYLDDLVITHKDYRKLFAQWKDKQNVCFIIDPPYLSTDAHTYTSYWKLKDYLDVLLTLKNTNYFYFTSEKSNVIELCEWMESNHKAANPFYGSTRIEQRSHMNYNSHYTDIMIYKNTTTPTTEQTQE
ncbi:MAG: DNA adenine methylase [Paludibacter sp.]|nr:DNA adenine methylase [Bacteroidales bacterium]MCM1068825.1 DNA adenine methylase [Prevotella sp.]MCM1353086.1 DNA adenine methylase [Bacteroides sp.]MCM1442408.1 DNA adenine methylase [Muribaculum sp.]MCM1481251.1 DNA adenine methylase [Paludibacter sp.]